MDHHLTCSGVQNPTKGTARSAAGPAAQLAQRSLRALLVGVVGGSRPNLIPLNKLFTRRLAVCVATVVAIGIAVGFVFNGLGR